MKGRFLKIKKTTLLRLSFIFNIFLMILFTSLFMYKNIVPDIWFYFFILFLGVHLLVKSFLFNLDSACYFGSILFSLGIFYIICIRYEIIYFYPVFILFSFSIGSFFCFYFFNQKFQLFLAISLFFVSITLFLFLNNLISIYFFLAIIVLCVLSLLSNYLML